MRETALAVPVREGVYGERVAAVEPGGVEFIPRSERHGHPSQLFWTWTSPNLEFATVYVGVLPIVLFGGGFWLTAIGLVLGTALGSTTHALLSTMGPRLGVPQMVASRGGFGARGNLLPAAVNAITSGAGWVAVNSVSGAFALITFCGAVRLPSPGFVPALALIVLIEIGIAFAGHNFIHAIERWVFPFLGIVFAACCVFILAHTEPQTGFNPSAPAAAGGPVGAFLITTFFAFAYAASWNPYASDYSRYLPETASPRRVALAAGLGMLLSCAALEIAGAGLATVAGTSWGPNDVPTDQFVKPLPQLLVVVAPLAICIGAIAANVLNLYSAAMSFLSMGIRIPARLRRALVAVGFGVIGFAVGTTGQAGPGSKYESFLFFNTYWIVGFLGVVLTDWALRRPRLDTDLLFRRAHRNRAGVVAFLLGIAACVPFVNQAPLFVGWVPRAFPQTGDIGFVAGFVVSAAVYALLSRGRPADADDVLTRESGPHGMRS